MFVKKKGLFSFLEGERYILNCDICLGVIPSSDALRTDFDTYAITIQGDSKTLCVSCFDRGFAGYRWNAYKSENPSYCCAICSVNMINVKMKEAKSRVRHVCLNCIKNSGNEDNLHVFSYSSDNEIWNSCSDCGTLRLRRHGSYVYWHVGSISNYNFANKCFKGNINQMECNHNLIDISDFRKKGSPVTMKDVIAADKALKKSLTILDRDPYPILTLEALSIARNGYLLQWCSRCGFVKKTI